MSRLEVRLQRLEAAVPAPRPISPLTELLPYLSECELSRLLRITLRATDGGNGQPASEQDGADYQNILTMATTRREAGWDPNGAQFRDLQDDCRAKRWMLWNLIFALRRRHPGHDFTQLSDTDFCNPLYVEVDEIETLVRACYRACSPEDLLAHADIIARMIVADRRLPLEDFQRLVFHGRLPAGTADFKFTR